MEPVFESVAVARFAQSPGKTWVDRVRQARREMMFDLVIETPGEPAEHVTDDRHRGGDVDRRAELVVGELVAAALRWTKPNDIELKRGRQKWSRQESRSSLPAR